MRQVVAKEPSKATSTVVMLGKDVARRYRDGLKRDLEKLDAAAKLVADELNLEPRLLPQNAFIGAPGTYARHVYNILADVVAGR